MKPLLDRLPCLQAYQSYFSSYKPLKDFTPVVSLPRILFPSPIDNFPSPTFRLKFNYSYLREATCPVKISSSPTTSRHTTLEPLIYFFISTFCSMNVCLFYIFWEVGRYPLFALILAPCGRNPIFVLASSLYIVCSHPLINKKKSWNVGGSIWPS